MNKVDEGDWLCLQRYVNKRETKRVAHHLVLQGLSCNPLRLPMTMYLKENSGGKNQNEVLYVLDKAFLDSYMHFSGKILVTSDSYIFPSIEKH